MRGSVYVFVDLSKEEKKQTELLSKLLELNSMHANLKLKISKENLGVANAIPNALDWFFSNEEFGIVCEDDVTISNDFIRFAEQNKSALNYEKLMMISAMRPPVGEESIAAVRYPLIWGWATNREKWELIKNYIIHPTYRFLRKESLARNSFLYSSFLGTKMNPKNSWILPIALTMRCNGEYCLIPPVNLSRNSGNDIYATHKSSEISEYFKYNQDLGLNAVLDREINCDIILESWIEKNIYNINFWNIAGAMKRHFVYTLKIKKE